MNNKTFNKKLSIALSFVVAIIIFITILFFQVSIWNIQKQNSKIEITEKYISFQRDISNILYSNINILNGYTAFLSTEKNLSEESTSNFLSELLKDKKEYIKSVAVIEDTTIVMLYPKEGNEKGIGVDLSKIEEQKNDVFKVKYSLKPVFQGPVNLVEGGTGFIIRIPVEKQGKYWGQVSIIMDADRFLKAIEEFEKELNIEVAIVNFNDHSKNLLYGNKALINSSDSEFDYNTSLLNWTIYINSKYAKTDRLYTNIFIFAFNILFSILTGFLCLVYLKNAAKIKYQADYDSLTGLYNRNSSIRYVPSFFENAKKRNNKLGVMILDINKFKNINDNFGHAVGDIILKDFANKLRAISRNSEEIFRIGGDEFMIICSNVISEEDMKKIKDKAKAALSYTLNIDSNEIRVSASIGYAMFPDNAEKAAEVINLADKNMYTDKQ